MIVFIIRSVIRVLFISLLCALQGFLLEYYTLSYMSYPEKSGCVSVDIMVCSVLLYIAGNFSGGLHVDEFTVFQEHYTMLCDTVTDIDDLLKYFVTERIISIDEEEEIKKTATKSEKVQKLLSHISGPLKAGDSNGFYVMLSIMKTRGVRASQKMAEVVEAALKPILPGTKRKFSRDQPDGQFFLHLHLLKL